jgi:alkyl hydroperoxide reductase subunit AhpF
MVLSDQELIQVQAAAEAMTGPVTITVCRTGMDDPFEKTLANIAAQISGVSVNRIALEESAGPILPGKPSLTLAGELPGNIHYLAAPEGHEFKPFLNALSWLGRAAEPPDTAALKRLDSVTDRTQIMILIADTCTYCPHVVESVLAMAVHQPLVNATIVDAIQFGDLAERFKVKSVPTTIINDNRTVVGQVGIDQLVDHLLDSQGPESLTADLDSMIQSGRAEDAASLLCESKKPRAILPLYASKEFSKRIGALVTIEEALAINPRILDPALDDLIDLLSHEDVGLRGDTAELLGKIGNPAAIPALKRTLEDPDPDVREAAAEALEALEEKNREGTFLPPSKNS